MTFSIRSLLCVVLLVAIFAAAFVSPTAAWRTAVANLTLVILLAALGAVYLGSYDKTFWMPFTVVGWLYFILPIPELFGFIIPLKAIGDALGGRVNAGRVVDYSYVVDDSANTLLCAFTAGINLVSSSAKLRCR